MSEKTTDAKEGVSLMKKIGIIVIFFLFFSTMVSANGIGLYLADHPVELTHPMMVVKGNFLVPVSTVDRYLASRTVVDGQRIQFEFPDREILMEFDSEIAYVDGAPRRMDVSPVISPSGEVMVPLRFIIDVLGLRLVFDPNDLALKIPISERLEGLLATQLTRDPLLFEERETDELEIVFLGGSRSTTFIGLPEYVEYEAALLESPARLMIDLFGVTGASFIIKEVEDPLVKRIRTSQFTDDSVRVVFDLEEITGYQIYQWPDGGMEVEFNHRITEVGFIRDESPKLWFKASEQPVIKVSYLIEPDRLVIDFLDSTLLTGAKSEQIDDPSARAFRVSQNMPSVTRVVLELNKPLTAIDFLETEERFEIIFFEGTAQEFEELLKQESEVEVEISETDAVLKGRRIVIDPGHGGSDPGSIGPLGTFEKDVVLSISLMLGEMLEKAGAEVFYTRKDDRYISIFDRPRIAEKYQGEILVSIHANSATTSLAQGTETLYHPLYLDNFHLAQSIQVELVSMLQLPDRGVRPRTDLAVLNGAKMTAALVEVAFLANHEEEVLLRTTEFQKQAAEGIYQGILRFFTQYR